MPDGITSISSTLTGASTGLVGNVISIGLPRMTMSDIDITEITDTVAKFIPGVIDAGEFTVGLNYEPDNANTLLAAFVARTAEVWTIVFSNAKTFTCTGYIKGLGGEIEAGGKVSQEVTIKVASSTSLAFST